MNLDTLKKNTQRLKNYAAKLILFPRKENKPKKGPINDSTADALKSANASHQVTDKHVLPITQPKKRVSQEKITADMQKAKVYRKLRQERVNKHYWGRREKRAREAEEAKK